MLFGMRSLGISGNAASHARISFENNHIRLPCYNKTNFHFQRKSSKGLKHDAMITFSNITRLASLLRVFPVAISKQHGAIPALFTHHSVSREMMIHDVIG